MRRGSFLRYLVPAHQLVVLHFLDVKRGVAEASSAGGPAEADLPGEEQPTKTNVLQLKNAAENTAQEPQALLDNKRDSVLPEDQVPYEQEQNDPNYDNNNYRELSTDDDFYNDTNMISKKRKKFIPLHSFLIASTSPSNGEGLFCPLTWRW